MTFSLPCVYRGYPWRIAFAQIKRLKAVSARQLSVDAHNQAVFPPEYQPRVGEDIEVKRARLRYQSRKRGILENGLVLSSFADKHLSSFSACQLDQYDHLINTPSNDWQLYHWFTGREDTPSDYNNEIMDLIKTHIKEANLSS